jgi:leucyl aminopeptidase
VSTTPGYQSPAVSVSATLPKKGLGSAVLIVPVVTGDDEQASVVANPSSTPGGRRRARVALKALGAKGGADQVTRVVAPSLPVGSVLAVGLGKDRDKWPADVIRRAAGVAARSLNGTETVITTLSDLDLSATIEGLILGAYRFTDFRSSKTAPKEPGWRR